MEAHGAVRAYGEHPVQPEHMEMDVEFQPASEPLHHGDRAAAAVGDAGAAGAAAIPAEHGADEHAQHGTAKRMVERQAVAEPVRHGEYPLAHRHPRQTASTRW